MPIAHERRASSVTCVRSDARARYPTAPQPPSSTGDSTPDRSDRRILVRRVTCSSIQSMRPITLSPLSARACPETPAPWHPRTRPTVLSACCREHAAHRDSAFRAAGATDDELHSSRADLRPGTPTRAPNGVESLFGSERLPGFSATRGSSSAPGISGMQLGRYRARSGVRGVRYGAALWRNISTPGARNRERGTSSWGDGWAPARAAFVTSISQFQWRVYRSGWRSLAVAQG